MERRNSSPPPRKQKLTASRRKRQRKWKKLNPLPSKRIERHRRQSRAPWNSSPRLQPARIAPHSNRSRPMPKRSELRSTTCRCCLTNQTTLRRKRRPMPFEKRASRCLTKSRPLWQRSEKPNRYLAREDNDRSMGILQLIKQPFIAALALTGCAGFLTGCTEVVPADLVEAVESIDRDLMQLRAAEIAPDDYAHFTHQWMTLKTRVEAEEDTIRWPWEPNELEQALRRLEEEGVQTVARLTEQRESLRRAAEEQLARVDERSRTLVSRVSTIDSRIVLGEKPVETDLLIKQARSLYEQGL